MNEDLNITDGYAFLAPINLPARGGTTDHVTTVLRNAIVTSGLPPGALINKHVICERLGVSRFPVSEALNRLQTEGLVEILPQRGTRVTRIRISDVEESMFIRRALEAETVRQLAPQASDALLANLERNMRYQQSAIDADDRQGFHTLDLEFHLTLMEALAYGRVRAAIDSARANLERARRILLGTPGYVATYAEHLSIFEAMMARDGDHAAAAMTAHLNRVMAELVAFSKARPEVFEPMD
ncbi:MAG: GntR family transcriptional regulator [Ancalomicrobiaceae bacterium]|nr:GntR family transcriptional regulator [Ancalomicrobiaceae bacterium]